MRSPNWIEEEVMLALDLYLNKDLAWINKMSDLTFEIIAMSKLLNGLDFYISKPKNFRSTGSIRMKLANFMALDERYSGKSLGNIGSLDKKVWEKYKNDSITLHEECLQIINKHLMVRDSDINKYINDMRLDNTTIHIDNDFAKFAKSLKKILLDYKKLAEMNKKNEVAKRIVESCEKMYKSLEWVKDGDEVILEYDYKEHAGINLKPVKNLKTKSKIIDSSEEKIGKMVRRTFLELIEQDRISDEIICKLLNKKYSHDQFGIKNTFLIEIDEQREFREQLMDENGYIRYWTSPVIIHEKKYCVCKEWYENQREKYLRWLSSINVSPFYMLKAKQLEKILKYLKDNDSKKMCITKQDIINSFPIETIDEVINILIKKGVLVQFQGNSREFVIDDYDTLFKMLKKPEEYSGE